jgi:hypothetical protein
MNGDSDFIEVWQRWGKRDTVAAQLKGAVAGDTLELVCWPTIPTLASGATRTITKAWLSIKAKETDADATENAAWSATAGARQTITTSEVAGRGVIYNNTQSSAELRFYVTASDSVQLLARRVYYFDVQVLMSDGAIYTIETGTFSFEKGITIATS